MSALSRRVRAAQHARTTQTAFAIMLGVEPPDGVKTVRVDLKYRGQNRAWRKGLLEPLLGDSERESLSRELHRELDRVTGHA